MASSPSETREERAPTTAIVGANVYRLRVLQIPKLSQQALADKAGVALETVRLLERNRLGGAQLNPQLDTIDKLAAGLGVEAGTLYTPTRVVANGKAPALRSIPGEGRGGDPFHQPPLLRPV